MRFYSKLTPKGRSRLQVITGLAVLELVVLFLTFEYQSDSLSGLSFIPLWGLLAYYVSLDFSLRKRLRNETIFYLGFHHAPSPVISMYDVTNRGNKNSLNGCFEGVVAGHKFHLLEFSVTTGSGKSTHTRNFIGAEFRTEKVHMPIQVYDKENDLAPYFKTARILESNEFHRYFKVFSTDPKIPFYQLDPDSMHDLLELRKHLGFGINIETFGNRLLIYVSHSVFDKKLAKSISIDAVLNGAITQEKSEEYKKDFYDYLNNLVKIYKTLDYKLENQN